MYFVTVAHFDNDHDERRALAVAVFVFIVARSVEGIFKANR